eukprot:671731-Prymnesium_polylepis.1
MLRLDALEALAAPSPTGEEDLVVHNEAELRALRAELSAVRDAERGYERYHEVMEATLRQRSADLVQRMQALQQCNATALRREGARAKTAREQSRTARKGSDPAGRSACEPGRRRRTSLGEAQSVLVQLKSRRASSSSEQSVRSAPPQHSERLPIENALLRAEVETELAALHIADCE